MVSNGYAGAQQSLDLASYIAHLPPDVKTDVFASSWTAQALFRALSPLAKQYILRLVYVDGLVSKESMQLWLRPSEEANHHKTLQQLESLSVLQSDMQGGVQLNPDFKRCLRAALSGRGLGADDGSHQAFQGQTPVQQLLEQAAKHWQAVLLYILDPEEEVLRPIGSAGSSFNIQDLLISAGLVALDGRRYMLTAEGFRYLLQATSEQVWLLLREYIKAAEQASGKELASTLSFLMQLSFRRVWQPYPLSALTPREQDIAAHMAQLGLVTTFKQDGATYFCATPLAASLCGGSGSSGAAAADMGGQAAPGGLSKGADSSLEGSAFIIVETNFRVYAHTSSDLQRRVLSRLMRTDCLLPNLYVGTLTRETFMRVLEMGLTAGDITRFLQQHAHPQVARRVPSVPENVHEQLVLWEGETRRVVPDLATMYAGFEDADLFQAAVNHAHGIGEMLWKDDQQQRFVVRRSGHKAIRNFIVEYKAQRARHQQL